mgnify:CR=1 FL=1
MVWHSNFQWIFWWQWQHSNFQLLGIVSGYLSYLYLNVLTQSKYALKLNRVYHVFICITLRIHVGNINTRTNVGLRALHWYVGLRAQHCRIVGALFVECHWFPGGWWLDMVCSHLPSKFVQGLLKRAPYNHTDCMFFLVPLFCHDI